MRPAAAAASAILRPSPGGLAPNAAVNRPLGLVVNAVRSTPFIILMVGVNGVGKTTTIGKLALRYKREGKSVMLTGTELAVVYNPDPDVALFRVSTTS